MRSLRLLVIVFSVVWGVSCARTLAHSEPLPELIPPPPPPRVVAEYVDEPLPTIEPSPAETALNSTLPKPPVKPPARIEPPKPETPKVEPERPAAPVAPPTLTLKPPTGTDAKTVAAIRDLLARARTDLGRVNYAALDADGRAQHESARRFIEQAEDALKSQNVVFAGKLADKAATMAAVLVR